MQSDNKHTDKKLQELENLSLPDLSRINEHWQQMRRSLQPASAPSPSKSPSVKRLFRWMIAAVLVGAMSLVAYKYIYSYKANRQQASGKINQPVVNVASKDSPILKFNHPVRLKDSPVIKLNRNIRLKSSPVIKLSTVKKDTAIILNSVVPEEQPKASLDKFFKQLEKGAQQFVINNNKDTLITGEDGTALHIPVNTFNTKGDVIITMKEFYSYEDIITNKLTTCSDGRQLVTGGMIHLSATVDGKEVDIQPGKSIQWFVPDTSREMNQMQLFTASSNSLVRLFKDNGDTIAGNGNFTVMNWVPQDRPFTDNYLVTNVKVLDLANEPMKTRNTKKGEVGIFRMADKPKISQEELQTELKEKYGYYKVKIKKAKKDNFFTRLMTQTFPIRRRIGAMGSVGDSAWVPPYIALQYKLQATDTATSIQRRLSYSNGYNTTKTFSGINMNRLAKQFSVDIRSLGWINCDRFYNNNSPKIEYYVDLKDTATNYYTLLVFDNIRSMIQGRAYGNKVVFSDMPEGVSAKVISIGIQNGKTVAAMEPVQISRKEFSGLKFEDTSPVAFKEEVKVFDR